MADNAGAQHELVSFEAPPVQEIAFAVQLIEASLSLEDMTEARRALVDRFPVQQLQPQLPRMATPTGPQMMFAMGVGVVQLPRLWFVSEDGLRLVQVQEDRIAFNWRRLESGKPYPRYGPLREEFEAVLGDLSEVVPQLDPDTLLADFCELTYVNELVMPDASERPQLPEVLAVACPLEEAEFLAAPVDAQWSARWPITDGSDEPRGDLTAAVQPAVRQRDQQPSYLMTMTAGLPGVVTGFAAMLAQLDLGHEWIVRGFADLTTKTMHDIWRRTQ